MSLTRSNMRQLSFLLEVAPLSGPLRNQSPRVRVSPHCALHRTQRRLHSGTAGDNGSTRQLNMSPSKQPTAQKQLLRDLGTQAPKSKSSSVPHTPTPKPSTSPNNTAIGRLEQALADAQIPLKRDRVVTEQQALDSLRVCFDLARLFSETGTSEDSLSPAMQHLFVLDADAPLPERIKSAREQAMTIRRQAMDKIAEVGHKIIVDPKVFITEKLLGMYVIFKGYLGRPDDLGAVFDLYANKPVPVPDSSPVKFKAASPDDTASAVPFEVAEAALDAAIESRNLELCLDIIDKSVCTKAFRKHKFVSQALVPSAALAAAPFAAYVVASQFAAFQDHMTTTSAKWVGFAGVTSYLAFTGTIGFVALTTANDQMERVTWTDGMPLRERWMREPERALLDKVALAWGFKNKHKWGEEEGSEWNALKELIGMRRMVLDRVELMEGMN